MRARDDHPIQFQTGASIAYIGRDQYAAMCDEIERLRANQVTPAAPADRATVTNAIAGAVITAHGDHVLLSKRYAIADAALDALVAAGLALVTPADREARELIEEIATVMQTEEGEPVHVMSEPDRSDHVYRTPKGVEFALRPAFDEETWDRIVTLAFDTPSASPAEVLTPADRAVLTAASHVSAYRVEVEEIAGGPWTADRAADWNAANELLNAALRDLDAAVRARREAAATGGAS